MMYMNYDTATIFTEDEVRKAYEDTRYEIIENGGADTFECYLDEMLQRGRDHGLIALDRWYAVMQDDDNDWSTGSFDIDQAKRIADNYGDKAYIAMFKEKEGEGPVYISTIRRDGDGWKDDQGNWI